MVATKSHYLVIDAKKFLAALPLILLLLPNLKNWTNRCARLVLLALVVLLLSLVLFASLELLTSLALNA